MTNQDRFWLATFRGGTWEDPLDVIVFTDLTGIQLDRLLLILDRDHEGEITTEWSRQGPGSPSSAYVSDRLTWWLARQKEITYAYQTSDDGWKTWRTLRTGLSRAETREIDASIQRSGPADRRRALLGRDYRFIRE